MLPIYESANYRMDTYRDLDGRTMHAVRRRILERIWHRMEAMQFGYTFIERCPTGAVLNADLRPFGSFSECCAAAEKAVNAQPAQSRRSAQVVCCRYDKKECIPDMQPVLKTYSQPANFN